MQEYLKSSFFQDQEVHKKVYAQGDFIVSSQNLSKPRDVSSVVFVRYSSLNSLGEMHYEIYEILSFVPLDL